VRVPENIRKCVAFVGYKDQRDDSFVPVGSAFYVGRDNGGTTASPVYAVTAKHVIDGLARRGVRNSFIRLNLRDGLAASLRFVDVPINSWYAHPTDASIDVVIFEMSFPSEVDQLVFPMSLIMTDERMNEHEVSLGDEVFVAGLFRHRVGHGRNIPIIRTGNIASIEGEKISVSAFGDMDAYLIEARSIGGLSGSPVFANLGFVRSIGGVVKFVNHRDPIYFLLGLVHGHYDSLAESADAGGQLNEKINTGIAIVTPYYNLLKVIREYENSHPERR
jgi:hypothetical protein